MNILILGDVVGASGRNVVKKNLPNIINEKNINFVIINGENAADDGKGITKNIAEEFFSQGIDVITSGNHIWDKAETTSYIEKENRLLRPANLIQGSPGRGFGIFFSKDKRYKIGVVNLMGNVFMRKTEDVFKEAKNICEKIKLKKNVDFLIVDFHGEITSEKMAIGHFFDGSSTCVVGTHTHVPTADGRVLPGGTAYLSDAGMCGPYASVLGRDINQVVATFLDGMKRRFHVAEDDVRIAGCLIGIDPNTGFSNKFRRVELVK